MAGATKPDSNVQAWANTQALLADKQVAERYGVHPSTVWRWTRENGKAGGAFPKPIKVSPGCARWRLSDLMEHEQKAAESCA